MTDGAQHGLAVTAMALLQPGDVVAVDALTYPGFKLLAQTLHLELLPIPAARNGPGSGCAGITVPAPTRARHLCAPSLHNPLGWVMGLRRRQELITIARKHGALIIEDAAYAYLANEAAPPLAALAPEITVYVNGLPKASPRACAWASSLHPKRIKRCWSAIRATTWNTSGVRPRWSAAGWKMAPWIGWKQKNAQTPARSRKCSPATG